MTAELINLAEARRARKLRRAPVLSAINVLLIAALAGNLAIWAIAISAASHAAGFVFRAH